jgi:hypothetical protein
MRYRGKEESGIRRADLVLTFSGLQFLGKLTVYDEGVRGTIFTTRIFFRGRTPGAWEDEKTILKAAGSMEEYDIAGEAKADVPIQSAVTITLGKGKVRLENRAAVVQSYVFGPCGTIFVPDETSIEPVPPVGLDLTGEWNVVLTNRERGSLSTVITLIQEGNAVRGNFPPAGDMISGAVSGTFDGKKLRLERALSGDTVQRYELSFERYALAGRYRNWGAHKDSGAIRLVRR